jgi:hypothetical protein
MTNKRNLILECFLENINTFQRVNVVADRLHSFFYDDYGNDTAEGKELFEYLCRLDDTANAIESQPRDYSLLKYIK